MMTSNEIRRQYIDFFVQKHGHTFVPSSPVVPLDDPTLLFTNAGMNQFKPIFLGQEKRAYTRAVNTQKCIRAGGKHNDLDDVGRSRRHHTFFEMLGNWSFGDYFKQGAIEMSWELLTKVWKLDPRRLHVTCFEGDEKNGVPRDTEAAEIWKKVGNWEARGLKSEDHIHYFGKDNFWEMGDTGPCGPCTEIYIDRRPAEEIEAERKAGGRAPVNAEDPRVIEIWNNVFIQYNRNGDRSLTVLPSQHVDTGMGFERITQVIQDVAGNYEIDLFHPFWKKLEDLSGHRYGGTYPPTNAPDPAREAANERLRKDIAFRVIADHIRCLTFALTDGAAPSNEGRGYVLRRILRRAVRFGRQTLGLTDPFLHKLVPVVVEAMGEAFPELRKNPGKVEEVVREEEASFNRTLDRGIALFEEAAEGKRQISGEAAFKLHDTYGFPVDLTRIMAEERGMSVDMEGYEKRMEEAREKARAGGKDEDTSLLTLPPDAIARLQAEKIEPTNDQYKYQGGVMKATVKAIWDGKKFVEESTGRAAVILNHTNFYAEMGGQAGDSGRLSGFEVESTRAVGGYILHVGTGRVRVGETVEAEVGAGRARTQKNHTVTHLSNWALREVLGEGVQQKGSLVDPERLRFDFSHGKSLEAGELERVEGLVNEAIGRKLEVFAEEVAQDEAMKINGLRAVFGEKYPPKVRVVSIGVPVNELLKAPGEEKWRGYSIEFCGGTHLANAQEAGHFAIVGEESVSKGIRRITALAGEAAERARAQARALEEGLKRAESVAGERLSEALAAIQKQIAAPGLPLAIKRKAQGVAAQLQSRLKAHEKSLRQQGSGGMDAGALAGALLEKGVAMGGGHVVVGEVAGAGPEQLMGVMDALRKKLPSFAVMLAGGGEEKVSFIAAVSDDLIARGLKAGDWIRETAKVAGGSGGGRPQLAQAGAKETAKLGEALERAKEFAAQILK